MGTRENRQAQAWLGGSDKLHKQGRSEGLTEVRLIYAICQSGDGYLWIGTDRGLVRFDGQKFTLIQQPLADQPATGPVRGLLEDSDGALWIRPQGQQMLLYRDGQFKNAFAGGGLASSIITAMATDGHGGWSWSNQIGLPETGLAFTWGVAFGDVNGDKVLDVVAGSGGIVGRSDQTEPSIPTRLPVWCGKRVEH